MAKAVLRNSKQDFTAVYWKWAGIINEEEIVHLLID